MMKYLQSAPEPLVKLHREKKINNGRDILERLLTDPAMNNTWRALGRKITDRKGWEALFKEIVFISRQAKRRLPSRRATRDSFSDIAIQARKLAKSIVGGRLDRLAYELFSADTMAVIGAPDWSDRDAMQRSAFAHSLVPVWPSFSDLLRELEAQAGQLAERAMTERRLVERNKHKPEALYFARALTAYCIDEFASPLCRPVTDIATVGLGYDVTEDFVKKAAKGRGT